MKNVFFVTYNPLWTKKIDELQQRYSEHTFVYCNNLDEFSQEIQDADTIVSGRISQDIVHSAPQCKAIFIPWTGVNHLPFSFYSGKRNSGWEYSRKCWFCSRKSIFLMP